MNMVSERAVTRADIASWAHSGLLDRAQHDAALCLMGVTPGSAAWHRFLSRLFLFMGVVFLAAALGYFVAYNWNDMGRFTKIGLLAIAVAVPAVLAIVLRDESKWRAALLAAFLATGPLLAYIGQTYQTGADTRELFAAWAALTLMWVMVARWRPVLALWLILVNTSVQLHFEDAWRPLGIHARESTQLLALIGVNGVALFLLEWFEAKVEGAGRIAERLCVMLVSGAAMLSFCLFVFDPGQRSLWQVPAALLALGALAWWTRSGRLDVVALAFVCLASIVCAVAMTGKLLSEVHFKSGAFLFGGLVAIGLSAMAAQWLTRLSRQQGAA